MSSEDTVFQYIEKAISEQRLPPGTRLREVQLADIFGVSRALIRKVLNRLVNAKLVEHRPHVGAQVACPSIEDSEDLFSTRKLLESAVVEQLCQGINDAQVEQLRRYLAQEQQAYADGDIQQGIRLSAGFHKQLAQLAGNRVIAGFLDEIINRTPLVMMSRHSSGHNGCVNDEHIRIVEALEQGDCQSAQQLMLEHLSQLQNMFTMKPEPLPTDLQQIFKDTT